MRGWRFKNKVEKKISKYPGLCKCGNTKNDNSKYCRECANAYMQHWRKVHPKDEMDKFKAIVRSKTKMRIKRGLLIKYPCEICGKKEVEAHHEDYNKPYEVRWLCREHHRDLHKTGIKKTSEGGL